MNPVELLWGNLKAGKLANLCVDTVAEMELAANQGIARMQGENDFALSFLRHTGFPCDPTVTVLREAH